MANRLKNALLCTSLMSAALNLVAPTALAAVVEGKVTVGGAPVEGAIVSTKNGQRTSTNSDGSYRFANLAAGEYVLTVSYVGADNMTASITATDNAPTAYNFVLGDETKVLEKTLVVGQRASMLSGINQQRAADNLISVLSADALGQFPDQNVAESARRMAGLSVANDQGEGRYVIIRGLDANLNSTSVNGVRLPSPEVDTRSVALDVVDADILESITVIKSLTPDLDGDGIGGAIDIKTMSAFDKDGFFLKAKADAIYSESSEKFTPKVSIAASNTFLNDTLGVAGSLSFNQRDFVTQNLEGDTWKDVDGVLYPEELELRYYDVKRERISSALNFDYRITNNTDLYLRSLYNTFEDEEIRHRVEFKANDGDEDTQFSLVNGIGTFTAAASQSDEAVIGADRDIKSRIETQDIWSTQLGGQTRLNAFTFDYQIAYSHSEEAEPGRIDAEFRHNLEGDDGEDYSLAYNLSNSALPNIVEAATTASLYDANEFEFEGAETVDGKTEENEFAAKFDITHEGNLFNTPGFVKGGAKLRLREKNYDVDFHAYGDDFNGDGKLLLSQFETSPAHTLDTFGPSVQPDLFKSYFLSNIGLFEESEEDSALGTYANNFSAFENIYAGYLMAQMDFGATVLTYGARVEATDFTGKGYFTTAFEGDEADAPDGQLVAGDADEGIYANYLISKNDYVDFLPSVNAKFNISDNIVARAAYFASIARPSLKQATPSSELELDDEGVWEAGFIGNPELNRQQANNLDVGIEFYPSNQGVLSVGFFMKDIRNPIAEVVSEDYEAFGINFKEATYFVNLDDASISGLEFNYQQSFDGILPGALGGLLIGANYTLLDSQTTYINEDGATRSIPLPKTSDNIANVVVGYDRYGVDLRAALTYRSEYLDEIFADGADRYFKGRYQVDLTGKYALTDSLTLVGEVSNVTNEPEHAVFKTPYGAALSQYDEYGYTAKFGVRYTY